MTASQHARIMSQQIFPSQDPWQGMEMFLEIPLLGCWRGASWRVFPSLCLSHIFKTILPEQSTIPAQDVTFSACIYCVFPNTYRQRTAPVKLSPGKMGRMSRTAASNSRLHHFFWRVAGSGKPERQPGNRDTGKGRRGGRANPPPPPPLRFVFPLIFSCLKFSLCATSLITCSFPVLCYAAFSLHGN